MPPDQTLTVLKPDALQRGLVGAVLQQIEQDGLRIRRLETVDADRELIEAHYAEHEGKAFYEPLIDFMTDRVISGIVEGENAAEQVRALAGATEPVSAEPGTIRGDLGSDSYEQADSAGRALQNLIHAAEPDKAERELALWFGK